MFAVKLVETKNHCQCYSVAVCKFLQKAASGTLKHLQFSEENIIICIIYETGKNNKQCHGLFEKSIKIYLFFILFYYFLICHLAVKGICNL